MAGIPVQLSKDALRRGRHDRHAFASIPRNPIYDESQADTQLSVIEIDALQQ